MDDETENVIVASFPKNKREAISVGISYYKGRDLIFVRTFVPELAGGGMVATRDGISLAIEKCPELVQGIRDLGNVMSREKMVARVKKNKREEVRIGTTVYKGFPLIYVRTYAAFGGEEDLRPTRDGVSMDVGLYPYLLEAIETLQDAVQRFQRGPETASDRPHGPQVAGAHPGISVYHLAAKNNPHEENSSNANLPPSPHTHLDDERVAEDRLDKCQHGVPRIRPCAICEPARFRDMTGVD